MTIDIGRTSAGRKARVYSRVVAASTNKDSLTNEAYEAVRSSILEGMLPPGHHLVEKDLAEQLGMSRTPVHEAVIRLESEGFLRVHSRRGVEILRLTPDDMREAYDVLIALEGMAALLLAKSRPESVLRELEEATKAMKLALEDDDLRGWATADDNFHRILIERCGNSRLGKLAKTLTDQAQRARFLTLRIRPRPYSSVEEHHQIIAYIRSGDEAQARASVENHRRRASKEIIEALAYI